MNPKGIVLEAKMREVLDALGESLRDIAHAPRWWNGYQAMGLAVCALVVFALALFVTGGGRFSG